MRDFIIDEVEKRTYKVNYEFTQHSFNWLLKFLDENRNLLLHDKNRLFRGILNEMDRILRCHSGKLKDIITISLVRALGYVYNYMFFEGSESERKKIFPLLDDVLSILSQEELDYGKINVIFIKILTEWRKYFIKFMDVSIPRRYEIERGILIPESVKEKLSESISKTLEQEIKREKVE